MNKAISTLFRGGIIAYPTDTVYGLGTDALNQESIKRMFRIKNRSPLDPISISLARISDIDRYAYIENRAFIEKLKKYDLFPGPVTLILKKRKYISDILTGGKNTIGVRVPNHGIARELVEELERPITTTSANISSQPPVSDYKNLSDEILEKVDYVVKGKCKYGKPSTVIDLTKEEPEILREGAEVAKIKKVISGEIEEED